MLSLAVLARTDVLILPHGADLINGFALHAAASVVEVMPVHQYGCPCDMYRRMYTYQVTPRWQPVVTPRWDTHPDTSLAP